jgi:ABC-2 type transport system ATP-binding protein
LKALFSREKVAVEAVKNVNFSIEPGDLVGFLGPNGAGKTTTLKMLSGILYPGGGEARVLGHKPFDRHPDMLRQLSLVMGNKNQLWWDLPAMDSFLVFKELYNISEKDFKQRSEFLIETLDLKDKVQTQVRKMSLGERMKCELVAALLHAPKVIFLDEPTIGLDLVSQKRIRDFLGHLNKEEGCTIILTSHYMQDVQELCERVIIIDKGTMMFDGTLSSLVDHYSKNKRLILRFATDIPTEAFTKFGNVIASDPGEVTIEVPREHASAITGAVLSEMNILDIGIEDVSLDEIIRNLFSKNVSRETLDAIPG